MAMNQISRGVCACFLFRGRVELDGAGIAARMGTCSHRVNCPARCVLLASLLQAAASVLQRQELPVDFEFYSSNFAVDLPVLVLSMGRSLLRDFIHVQLPLQPAGAGEGREAGAGRRALGAGPQSMAVLRLKAGALHRAGLQCACTACACWLPGGGADAPCPPTIHPCPQARLLPPPRL